MAFQGLTDEQARRYEEDGYVILKSLFDREEIDLLLKKARSDPDFNSALERKDEKGNITRLKLWNHPPDNLYGLFPRSKRMVGIAERLIGRINHMKLPGGQTGADLERVEQAKKHHELVYVELGPGDVVVFHCNLLHASAANESDKPRWTLICCYNAARNDPWRQIEHPCYTPLVKVPDEAILSAV